MVSEEAGCEICGKKRCFTSLRFPPGAREYLDM